MKDYTGNRLCEGLYREQTVLKAIQGTDCVKGYTGNRLYEGLYREQTV